MLLLGIMGLILFSDSSLAAEGKKFTFKAATHLSDSSAIMPIVKNYVNYVSEHTNGNVEIVVYPSEQLGGYEEVFEEIMRGTIEMEFSSVSAVYDNNLSCASVSGFAEDIDDLEKILRRGSTIFKTIDKAMDGLGIKLLGYMTDGFLNVIYAGNLEPGYGDPDIRKKSVIRVPSGQDTSGLLEAIGYNTAALPGIEVYSGLQTGVINGSIGQPDLMVLSHFRDVVDHIVDYKLLFVADWVFINQKIFESLPNEYQKVMEEGMDIFMADNIKLLRENEKKAVKELKESGIEYINLTPDERAKINAVIEAKYWPLLEARFGPDFLAGVKSDINK
jgi:TRAP-type C4-dicarboxylate transport system substrate-binding protein